MGISGRISQIFLHSQMTPLIALIALLLGVFAVLVTPVSYTHLTLPTN